MFDGSDARASALIRGPIVLCFVGGVILIVFSEPHVVAINAHGERDYPYECCGLLIGRFLEDGSKEVVETYPISNAREERTELEASLRRMVI